MSFNPGQIKWKCPIPLSICAVFYAILCIFSIVVGIITISSGSFSVIELNQDAVSLIENALSTINTGTAVFFGLITIVVGILQGLASAFILLGHSRIGFWYAIGFTLFSLLSCSSKLFMSVNLFSIAKIAAYILVLVFLLLPVSRIYFKK